MHKKYADGPSLGGPKGAPAWLADRLNRRIGGERRMIRSIQENEGRISNQSSSIKREQEQTSPKAKRFIQAILDFAILDFAQQESLC